MSTIERKAIFQVNLQGIPLRQEELNRIEQLVRTTVLSELAKLDALSSTTIEPMVVQPMALVHDGFRTQGINVRASVDSTAAIVKAAPTQGVAVNSEGKAQLAKLAGQATETLTQMAAIVAHALGETTTTFSMFSLQPASGGEPMRFIYTPANTSTGNSAGLVVNQHRVYWDPPGICQW